jgi:hypothetical protein
MYSPEIHQSRQNRQLPIGQRAFLVALLPLIAAIPASLIRANDTQANTATTASANPNAATQPSDSEPNRYGWPKSTWETSMRMRELGSAIWQYASSHNDRLPPDLGSVLGYFKTHRDGAERCLTPGNERHINIPDNPSSDWVNHNASYIYLAARANLRKIAGPDVGATVMLHTRLDQPFSHSKVGDVAVLTFIDGHTELLPVAEASKIIESSKKTLAVSRGSP